MPVKRLSYVIISSVALLLFSTFFLTACQIHQSRSNSSDQTSVHPSTITISQPDQAYPSGDLQRQWVQPLIASSQPFMLPLPDTRFERINTEKYISSNAHKFVSPQLEPVLNLQIDNNTASYTNIRRYLRQGYLPPHHAVRIEEMLNYFSLSHHQKHSSNNKISITQELSLTPWNNQSYLLNISINTKILKHQHRSPVHLIFIVDHSGSMRTAKKLPLIKQGIRLAASNLNANDKITIIGYTDRIKIVLENISPDSPELGRALDSIQANGTTSKLLDGIIHAYRITEKYKRQFNQQHIFMASDGDISSQSENDLNKIKQTINRKNANHTRLSVLGFGVGNYNDQLLHKLTVLGSGDYNYIDGLSELRRVLVDTLQQRLNLSAEELSFEFELNPNTVREYRLIGFNDRFTNSVINPVQSQSINTHLYPGQTINIFFELKLNNSDSLGKLRYQRLATNYYELGFLKVTYRDPVKGLTQAINKRIHPRIIEQSNTTDTFRFFSSVVAFGQKLRDESYTQKYSYQAIEHLARNSRGNDPTGDKSEFIRLVQLARSLSEINQGVDLVAND